MFTDILTLSSILSIQIYVTCRFYTTEKKLGTLVYQAKFVLFNSIIAERIKHCSEKITTLISNEIMALGWIRLTAPELTGQS